MQLKWASELGEQQVWTTALAVSTLLLPAYQQAVVSIEHEGCFADIAFVVVQPDHIYTQDVLNVLIPNLPYYCEILLSNS